MNSILFLNEKLFIIFLFFHIFLTVNSSSFDYPYYLTLSNNNIFIIHRAGIDIYDSSFNKIEQIIQFSGEEEMTEEIFEKIRIKYDNEYILSIINDKIYIFNNEGKFLYKEKERIYYLHTIEKYSLTSIGLYNNEYKYVIGFFNFNTYLFLVLYSYNIKENTNNLVYAIRNEENYISEYNREKRFSIRHWDLSCEYTKYSSDSKTYLNLLTCFFFTSSPIGTTSYKSSIATTTYYISDNFKIEKVTKMPSITPCSMTFEDYDYGPNFIKSETNYNRTLAFVWFHFIGKNRTYFATFNTSSNTMENQSWIDNCSKEIYKTKINKFPKNKELALTYETNDTMIRANVYYNIDNYNYNISYFELNASCENINGLAILYYNNNQNYYIYYCFKNCSDEFYKNDSYCLNLERKQSSNNITIYIIIAVIVIILLIISIFIYIKYFRRTKEQIWKQSKKDEKLMNDFLAELVPNDN